jgi:hypothetical protein
VTFAEQIGMVDRAIQSHLGSVKVQYRPAHEDPYEVVGMFDERFVLIDKGDAGVEQVTPALFVRLEDLKVHPDDDEPTIEINEITYKVRERQVDGLGGIRLLLHKVDA